MAITVRDFARFKQEGRRFVMLTAYDYPTAAVLDEVGIPFIFVGDTLGQVILGYNSTVPVTMDEMIHHTKAVRRGVKNGLLIADLPFGAYFTIDDGLRSAGRLVKEGSANVVKLEGPQVQLTEAIVSCGIPVLAHLGLTPQSVNALGGTRVQARTDDAAEKLVTDAQALESAGACALVLEAVPATVAKTVTEAVVIPTIGIGAGPSCVGQVLVITDLLDWTAGMEGRKLKFVKHYAHLRDVVTEAVRRFEEEVAAGTFPDAQHSYA
jgi:3-methyl-2-oxobutanoate hydroxymethyltransferase